MRCSSPFVGADRPKEEQSYRVIGAARSALGRSYTVVVGSMRHHGHGLRSYRIPLCNHITVEVRVHSKAPEAIHSIGRMNRSAYRRGNSMVASAESSVS